MSELNNNETLEVAEPAQNESSSLASNVMHEQNMNTVSKKQVVGKVFSQIGLYLFLGLMAFVVIFPFLWMVGTSLKHKPEYYDENLELILFPSGKRDFLNFAEVFTEKGLEVFFFNTLIVGVASTLMSLVITVLSAFALARLEFKGKGAFFALLLATMMIPGELFTITNYKTYTVFGWDYQPDNAVGGMNAFLTLTIPFLVSVFYIYLLRQNFMQIPNELYLAAKIDGTTDFKYLLKVMIPLAMPTLISITILKMMGAWNTYMWPKLTITNDKFNLITVGLREMDAGADVREPDIPLQMAAVTLVSLPLFMVFIFLRKYIMHGVSRSGIKG